LERNKLHDVIPVLYPEYSIYFELKPSGTVSGYGNIMRLNIGENQHNGKFFVLWFNPGTTSIHLRHAANSIDVAKAFKIELALDKWSTLLFRQVRMEIK
jgi:hypothetical protein